jgi:hypothetical protein
MKTILAELDRMATKGQLGKGKVFEPVVKTILRLPRSSSHSIGRCGSGMTTPIAGVPTSASISSPKTGGASE